MERSNWWGGIIVGLLLVGGVSWWFGTQINKPFYPIINSPRPIKGPAQAGLLLEEFSDFQCPACKAANSVVIEVEQTFGDRLQLSYRHFPLISIHPQAFRAALAAECANDQGKFWEYHDKLFEKQPAFSSSDLIGYAGDLGLDKTKFAACLNSEAKTDVVRADMREGDKRQINATPTFFLNGQKISDWTKLKEIIQGKLLGS